MGISWCDSLAVDEAIFVDASVDRVAVGGLYITATVGLYVPARILVARGFIIGVFAAPRPLVGLRKKPRMIGGQTHAQ
jgi:hypothetical protein